jgi:hypothetical protein
VSHRAVARSSFSSPARPAHARQRADARSAAPDRDAQLGGRDDAPTVAWSGVEDMAGQPQRRPKGERPVRAVTPTRVAEDLSGLAGMWVAVKDGRVIQAGRTPWISWLETGGAGMFSNGANSTHRTGQSNLQAAPVSSSPWVSHQALVIAIEPVAQQAGSTAEAVATQRRSGRLGRRDAAESPAPPAA